jgi:hypothetical protein
MTESWQETFRTLDAGGRYQVQCPDGRPRTLWGYNGATGDLFLAGWQGDAWMDCSDGTLRVAFVEPLPPTGADACRKAQR